MPTSKRTISTQEQQLLRGVLQTATLAALMDSRRWEPGDIAFQGGTSLHLAHGSARFSEDLDFMVRGGLSLEGLAKDIQKRLRLPLAVPNDLRVSVTPCKDQSNPHQFYVGLSGPMVEGGIKVKIELWQTQAAALKSLQLTISTVASPGGQAFVPTLVLAEIFADKVYALGARKRIKPRDVFDLWWLCEKEARHITPQALQTRLAIYPARTDAGAGATIDTATAWLENAKLRLADLQASQVARHVCADLKRWLPSSWPMDEAAAAGMVKLSATHLQEAIFAMHNILTNLPSGQGAA